MHMNLIDISQKILRRKNYFPWNVIFSPEISHIHTLTKMGFPINKPKMAQHNFFENDRTGWFMTHFDRRDLLNSKK